MSIHIRRTIPILIASLVTLVMVAEGVFVSKEIESVSSIVRDWSVILSGFALCLGGINVIAVYSKDIMKRTPKKWQYNSVLFLVMAAYIVIGLALTTTSGPYQWLFNSINFPLIQTMFSLLAFYIFSAAVRSFRARNLEIAIFLVCALVVIIGNIPSIAIFLPEIGAVGPWLQDVPAKGAFRGLLIATAVGAIIVGLRTILGRETSYFGSG